MLFCFRLHGGLIKISSDWADADQCIVNWPIAQDTAEAMRGPQAIGVDGSHKESAQEVGAWFLQSLQSSQAQACTNALVHEMKVAL